MMLFIGFIIFLATIFHFRINSFDYQYGCEEFCKSSEHKYAPPDADVQMKEFDSKMSLTVRPLFFEDDNYQDRKLRKNDIIIKNNSANMKYMLRIGGQRSLCHIMYDFLSCYN